MSSDTVNILKLITNQSNIYGGFFVFFTGMIGNILNIIIFTSLKTFRQTSCGFYLTVTSIFNVGQAIFALITRILDSGFSINLKNLPWSCKLRTFLAQSCVLLSLTSMSLVTIDQFISMTKYRHFSNLKLAHRHIIIGCCIWCCHGIFALLYWDTPTGICISTGISYRKYLSYFYVPVLLGCLPIVIMVIFSLLSYFKIRTIASRQINIVRLSHDRQLTAMALSQVAFIVFASIPYTTYNIYDLNTILTDPNDIARHRLIGTVVVLLYYESFAVSDLMNKLRCVIDLFLEFILYILLCIKTFSSTTYLCSI